MEEVIELGGVRMSNKSGWLWSLYISALATSGYAREAFDVVELMSTKGMHNFRNSDLSLYLYGRMHMEFLTCRSLQGVPAH